MMSEEAKMDQKKKEGDGLKKTVAFMAGLSLYQLPYLAMAAAKYSLARFQIPMSLLSLYISRMIVLFRVLSLIGIALLTLYSQCKGPYQRQMTAGFFIAFSLCFVFLFLIYCTGGEQGHLTLYYWGLGAASFLLGAAFTTIVDIVTENVVFLLLSLPLTGVFVSIFHLTFIFFWELFGLSNINYWLVVCQLIIAICITSIHALLYTITYWSEDAQGEGSGTGSSSSSSSSNTTGAQGQDGATQEDGFMTALGKAWSPILLISLGYGIHNAFYPGIAPYKLTDVKTAYNIDLVVLFTSALAPLSILILKDKKMGPDVQWIKGNSIWHASWIFFLIEMTCATIFICGLHSPGAAISRAVKSSPAILGLMTVTYDLCAQLTRSIGTNGADMQSYEKRSNSAMNTLNSFSYGFTQVIFASMGDGYLKTYSKYEHDRSKWPTQHFGILRSFWFWYWTATKVSFKAIGGSFCLDVRGAIQTKKEVLFIVYSDEVDNSNKPPKAENPTVMKIVYDI
ncbi:conserved hypothetical protein [Theileria equi strain WA]|uniref:Uncharacterized protein n=1 Tax=Theileria equi strain WA TaxID=1537102 RepID=L1LAK3_THEEQ|nr:conserved hypothetical protein [Theileria equi strain WA]EKX72193.1 conserved hypothetical protein [Theileria equi strain WA]|eukprot:XP_004831645.1 conserved hypothetical protein [Theileria equi strain WA]